MYIIYFVYICRVCVVVFRGVTSHLLALLRRRELLLGLGSNRSVSTDGFGGTSGFAGESFAVGAKKLALVCVYILALTQDTID